VVIQRIDIYRRSRRDGRADALEELHHRRRCSVDPRIGGVVHNRSDKRHPGFEVEVEKQRCGGGRQNAERQHRRRKRRGVSAPGDPADGRKLNSQGDFKRREEVPLNELHRPPVRQVDREEQEPREPKCGEAAYHPHFDRQTECQG